MKLIIDANPGKEDKIYDEFDAASATNGLDDFFEKYKDVLEPKKEEPKESEAEDDYNEIIDDANTTEKVSPSENVNDAIEPIKKSDLQKTCEVLNISESDSFFPEDEARASSSAASFSIALENSAILRALSSLRRFSSSITSL